VGTLSSFFEVSRRNKRTIEREKRQTGPRKTELMERKKEPKKGPHKGNFFQEEEDRRSREEEEERSVL